MLKKIYLFLNYKLDRYKYNFKIKNLSFFDVLTSKLRYLLSNLISKIISKKFFFVLDLSKNNNQIYSSIKERYKNYVDRQIQGNKFKINSIWAKKKDLNLISIFLNNKYKKPLKGICQGTRNGFEQKYFSKKLYPGSNVFGTEISKICEQFYNTVCWDFNIKNPKWESKFDFVYSNSHDHAYDLQKTLKIWLSYLKNGGVLILHHTSSHGNLGHTYLDSSAVETELFPFLMLKWFGDKIIVGNIKQNNSNKKNSNIRNEIYCFYKLPLKK